MLALPAATAAMTKRINANEILNLLEKELENFDHPTQLEEVGTVISVGDGVALVYGLQSACMGELVTFDGAGQGIIMNLTPEYVGIIILEGEGAIREGHLVKRTQKLASIPVSENLIGRVISTLGKPIDGKGPIDGPFYDLPLERKAPGVIYREPVVEPLQTGVKKIDMMIPIGLGQRELIVGDRGTGKTTLATDTIINQRRNYERGDTPTIHCIYVAIGQKASSVSYMVNTLEAHGAMDYTTVMVASAATSASLQYLAPFAGMAIGEFFRDTGRHALIILDDLSKQAISYREISLLLKRVPAREAYPGDMFYVQSRILERAAKINRNDEVAQQMNNLPDALRPLVKGGGSLTALPIVETQSGDVSAYIPTNIISITDGQIFLETDLFNAGIRPAINAGISVSRVGGNAQSPTMKKLSGTLRITQAGFAELESFSKIGAEVDEVSQRIINKGRKDRELLKQPPHAPVPLENQILTLFSSVFGFIDTIPKEQVNDFVKAYIRTVTVQKPDLIADLRDGILTKKNEEVLRIIAKQVVATYTDDETSE